jgi:hypothetical protein
MKIVHSYIPSNFNLDIPYTQIIWKEMIYSQVLSTLFTNKNYGKISLYTNETIAKQIQEIGIPYDNIDVDVLSKTDVNTFSVVKMKVFKAMSERFLHIDIDTMLTKKIDFKSDLPVIYAHKDFPDLGPNTTPKGFNDYLISSMNAYGFPFNDFKDQHSENKIKNFFVGEVPNMNLLCVNDYELFAEATERSLDHYYKNKEKIDSYDKGYGACYVEQLMIHLNLMETSDDYYNSIKNNEAFLCDKWFFQILQERKSGTYLENDFTFPLTFKNHLDKNFTCDCCGGVDLRRNEHTIESLYDLKNFFNHDFGGIWHLSHHKWSPIIQCLVIGQIAHNFGVDWLYKINEHFRIKNQDLNLGLPNLSPGEKLYEKVTGFRFYNRGMI